MTQIKIKRGLQANRLSITPPDGELLYTTDDKKVYIGDNVTAGGNLIGPVDNQITGGGATGQVSFWNGTGTQTGDNGLFWDNTNKRLNIGNAAQVGKLDVFTGSSIGLDVVGQTAGSISLTNLAGSSHLPSIIAKGTTANSALIMMSTVPDTNSAGYDMRFDVRENNNTDFTTLTTPAFKFSRFSNDLMTILRNGNVGIGTSTPTLSKLQVESTGNVISMSAPTVGGTGVLSWYNSVDTRRGYLGFGTTSSSTMTLINEDTNGHIAIMTNGTGNVGIGNAAPSQKLEVNGNLLINAANGFGFLLLGGSGFYRENFTDVGIRTNSGEKIRILDNGNVGIGTAAPTEKLDVVGNIRASSKLISGRQFISQASVNQTISGKFFNVYSTVAGSQYNLLGLYATTDSDTDVFTHTTGELSKNFYIGLVSNLPFFNNGVAGSERFSIINKGIERFSVDSFSGNVGIGINNPAEKLDVVGNIKASGNVQATTFNGVKVYKALISQSGTAAPAPTVISNSITGTPTWTYIGVGEYRLIITGAFTLNKTIVLILNGQGGSSCSILGGRITTDHITIKTFNSAGTQANDCLNLASVSIEVYP